VLTCIVGCGSLPSYLLFRHFMLVGVPLSLSTALPLCINPLAAKPMWREVGAVWLDLGSKASQDWSELPLHLQLRFDSGDWVPVPTLEVLLQPRPFVLCFADSLESTAAVFSAGVVQIIAPAIGLPALLNILDPL
jgi:hypothetical protein